MKLSLRSRTCVPTAPRIYSCRRENVNAARRENLPLLGRNEMALAGIFTSRLLKYLQDSMPAPAVGKDPYLSSHIGSNSIQLEPSCWNGLIPTGPPGQIDETILELARHQWGVPHRSKRYANRQANPTSNRSGPRGLDGRQFPGREPQRFQQRAGNSPRHQRRHRVPDLTEAVVHSARKAVSVRE